MSNETKQEINTFPEETEQQKNCPYCHEVDPQSKHAHYGKALPDDLPVIPELIGKYLKMWKHDHGNLFQAFDEGTSASLDGTKWESVQDWFSDAKDSFDTFARAWVLGVWRVEETGEVVKL